MPVRSIVARICICRALEATDKRDGPSFLSCWTRLNTIEIYLPICDGNGRGEVRCNIVLCQNLPTKQIGKREFTTALTARISGQRLVSSDYQAHRFHPCRVREEVWTSKSLYRSHVLRTLRVDEVALIFVSRWVVVRLDCAG